MVVPYFLHLPRSHNETRDRFTSITCFISLFYFLKPDENCSAMQVLEDMHKCLDIPELSYVDDTMGLFIMLPRAMGSSSKATHKLSKATTSWRPGKLLPATPLAIKRYLHPHVNMYVGNRDWDQKSHFNIVSKVSSFKFERGIKISQHVKDSSSGTF